MINRKWILVTLLFGFGLINSVCYSQKLKSPTHNKLSQQPKTVLHVDKSDSAKFILDAKRLIVGTWEGQFENIKVTIGFNSDGTAYSVFSSDNKKNPFIYRFISPHIVLFSSGRFGNQRYYIQTLTASNFHYIKYPIQQDVEEISIVETIDFIRK